MSDADGRQSNESGPEEEGIVTHDLPGAAVAASDRRIRAIRHGARSAETTAPQFSQPVRQILMMLIVLALVGAGGWFAYGRILSIFSANEFLNGIIIFVFALGVITCFWQVAQLVKCVNWIERFAQRRRNAVERGAPAGDGTEVQDAPTLLAPLAALLGGRGPAGGVISTASSRSILDSVAARIDEGRDVTRYLSSLLIFLGLLGTFYGLATTVPAVVETIRALQPQEGESGLQVFDKLMTGLEGQLGGMATAFSSSLLGLAGSLVVGLLELFATHGQNRFYRELEEWVTSFTRIGLSGADGEGLDQATVAGFLDQITGQMADLHEFYLTRDASREAETAAAEARMARVTQGFDELANRIVAQGQAVADETQSTARALERLADGQDRGRLHVENSHHAANQHAEDTRSVLIRIAEGQAALAERLVQDRAGSAAQSVHAAAAVQRLAEGQQVLGAELVRDRAESRSQSDALAEALAALVAGQDRLIELAQAPAAPAYVAAPVQAEAETDDSAAREAQMRLRSIDNQIAKLVEEMAVSRGDLIADLRADLTALTRAIRRLGQGDEA
ncbi:coiled-coil domain-containing protein [Paracoccus aminophilus]|uniref:Biopolymer transporter ExbB n=1 Tax=Paracoccus aminophilus JCM 7686 TaxID=1367847 RepID=S5XLK0_PARAH|nr:hypothetical protein [Paracoccus aminophilus]AGT08074.1 hypothetical protein JCM7686_0965 [Paracoccus aminophilus JCM 7686]